MKHYKTVEQLKADLNEHKDLIVPDHDVTVDFDIPKGVLRNVECRDFNGWNFNGCDFIGFDFNGCDFNGNDFNGNDFNGWNFNGRNFIGFDFNGWNFNGCDFNGNDFNGNDFNGWNFNGDNFSGRNFKGWNFNGRDFNGFDFNGRDFNGDNFISHDFNGDHISYYASFVCYDSCSCLSYTARRLNALPIQCLDGELTVREPEPESHKITLADGRTVEISADSYEALSKAASDK